MNELKVQTFTVRFFFLFLLSLVLFAIIHLSYAVSLVGLVIHFLTAAAVAAIAFRVTDRFFVDVCSIPISFFFFFFCTQAYGRTILI